jgi:hypothetical protein
VIVRLEASFHPFLGFPRSRRSPACRSTARAAAMREPARKAGAGREVGRVAGDGTAIPPLVDILLAKIELISAGCFRSARTRLRAGVMQSFWCGRSSVASGALERSTTTCEGGART